MTEGGLALLRRLANNPGASQRELAKELGISLGKTNYCLKALLDKGYIKADNFKNSQNKRSYLYKPDLRGNQRQGERHQALPGPRTDRI